MSTIAYRKREREHILAHNKEYHLSIYVPVKCKTCQKEYEKRRDSIKWWKGNCHSCAMKEVSSLPHIKQGKSERARIQVLKQGGVPNAVKFDGINNGKERHARWKGGITPETQILRGSQKTHDWRRAVYIRDNFTCVVCGQVGGKLEAHHIKSWSEFPELRFCVDNGVTACKRCHKEILHEGAFHKKIVKIA